ncbi:MAG: hypothetical protein AAF390_04420 [Pseudomonadota bacterium]
MLGWKLFLRAINLILDNLGAALRISALPYGIAAAVSVWVAMSWPESIGVPMQVDPENPLPPDYAGALVLSGAVTIAASLWIAVGWHRYVLLAEGGEGWVPPFNGGIVLGYLGRSILVGLAVGVIVLAISTMASVLLLPLLGPSVTPLIGALALFVAMILFYRLGVVLPAGAVGRSMTFGEAMRSTAGHSGTAVILALLTVAFSFLLQLPTALEGSAGAITVVYEIVVGWIGLIIGVGTLTALYGVVVEGRPVE